MKHMKFATGLFLTLALASFISQVYPVKVFAAEKGRNREDAQIISSDFLSEEDEKVIEAMISAYQRSRIAAPKQLEAQISNYFEAQYGTARGIYVVEFRTMGSNGSISGRLVYVLMGNDALKRLNQASGGFVIPKAVPKAGYAFDGWSYNGVRVESEDLDTYDIYESSIFYAEFASDTNGDGIPDHQQRTFSIQFSEDTAHGTIVGDKLNFVAYEAVDGEGCYISEAIGFQEPSTSASPGYTFDYWFSNEEKVVDDFNFYKVDQDLIIWPVFAEDSNYDDVPDYRQTLYSVDFVSGSGGTVSGNTHYTVSARENALGELEGRLELTFPNIWERTLKASPDAGYIFEYWIDQNGDKFYPEKVDGLWESFWLYRVKGDTVFAAVFSEDINGDGIPDNKQTFFDVDFIAAFGGSLVGETHYIIPAYNHGGYGYIGRIRDAFPRFNSNEFRAVPDDGYTLDHWIDHKGKKYSSDSNSSFLHQHAIEVNSVFVAVFAEDVDGNGISDYREMIMN